LIQLPNAVFSDDPSPEFQKAFRARIAMERRLYHSAGMTSNMAKYVCVGMDPKGRRIYDMRQNRDTWNRLENNSRPDPGVFYRKFTARLNQVSNAWGDRLPPDGSAFAEMVND
jgi:hypothetical protein